VKSTGYDLRLRPVAGLTLSVVRKVEEMVCIYHSLESFDKRPSLFIHTPIVPYNMGSGDNHQVVNSALFKRVNES